VTGVTETERPGIEIPDRRGRTGLDRVGRELDGNPRVRVRDVELLASDWFVLRKSTLDVLGKDGQWTTQTRETYDRGDGATVLLYDAAAGTILLVRQFRYPAYVNGHPTGDLEELPAGLLDADDAEAAIRREIVEETGLTVGEVTPVFELYMSPGSVTERLHFFAAPYVSGSHASHAGIAHEGEETEMVEWPIGDAIAAIGTTIVDAKTAIMLYWARLTGPFSER
jgi:nudix-type nucleoside diphosphatase (YffH/AdpP family)